MVVLSLFPICRHISASIHSDDIIIRSTSLSIATEIINKDGKMAVRHLFRHGWILVVCGRWKIKWVWHKNNNINDSDSYDGGGGLGDDDDDITQAL